MVSRRALTLHGPGKGGLVPLQVLTGHQYSLSGGKSVHAFSSLHSWVIPLFLFLLLGYCSSSYTLERSRLTDNCAGNTVSPLDADLLIFLVVSFKGQSC